MQMNNIRIPNTSNSFEAMLEAFFNVQHNEHMKAWRWHLYTSKYDQDACDAALRDSLANLKGKRNG